LPGRWIAACETCGSTYDKRSKKPHQCKATPALEAACPVSTDEWFCTWPPTAAGMCEGHLGQQKAGMAYEPPGGWTYGPGVRISCTAKGGLDSTGAYRWQCKRASVGVFANTIELCAGHMWQRQNKMAFTAKPVTPGLTKDEIGKG
jgi:hypothetical protein